MSQRLATCFAQLKQHGHKAFIPFIMGGDPDLKQSLELLKRLPAAGADIIEIGIPFSDPMADGPVIEAAGLRALANGTTLAKVLDMVKAFRADNTTTPIILMGYYNPIYRYGVEEFTKDATAAGVDGLIIVDLPPEEEAELTQHSSACQLDLIRLVAPTTTAERQAYVTRHASGFVYYISVKGITGSAAASEAELEQAIARLRAQTSLPIAIGFGIKTPEQAKAAARLADAVVIGSALVQKFSDSGIDAALELAVDIGTAIKSAK